MCKKSQKLQNNFSWIKQLGSNITPHTYVPVSKNPWTCLKNHGLCQVPISFSFPGSQQSTRLPVITTAWSGIVIYVKVKVQKTLFLFVRLQQMWKWKSKKNLFVLICFCEFAINLKVKVQKNVFVLIWDCWIAINVKVQINCFLVDMELRSAWKFGSAKDLFRQDTQRKWKCKNLFSGVDKTLNEVKVKVQKTFSLE